MTTTASAPSKGKTIGYWVTTGLIGLAFLTGGAGDLAGGADMVAAITHLGYPAYLLTILGVAKLLGAVAVLVPRFPRLKEWAYAGIVIDLLGASASHAFTGDGLDKVIPPLVLTGIAMASWALRPESRRLPSPAA
jgi:uncharacterized membrane protein YphA (DoxX/SURF4 family)